MAKIKNVSGLTDKIKSDLISSLEKMLSGDMINGLNTAKYKIGDIVSYEKKKSTKRLDINIVESNGSRVLSIYTGEKFTENKVSDSKSKFRDNQVYSGVLESLSRFFHETIYRDNIRLMISSEKLIEKSLVNLERLQELCLKPTRTSNRNKWSKKEILDRLVGRRLYGSYCGRNRINNETMGRIIELRTQILKECFDLSVFNYIPEQKKIKDNIVEIELDYYNHYTILPALANLRWGDYFKDNTDMLTRDILNDVLNRFPANGDSDNRFEDIYIPVKRSKFFGADYLNVFFSKVDINRDIEHLLIFNISTDLLGELCKKLDIHKQPTKDEIVEVHNLLSLYFRINLEMLAEVELYKDIISGEYRHSSLRTEEDRLNLIAAIDKNYPYLKDCREKGILDMLLNTAIYFKVENSIYSANKLAARPDMVNYLLSSYRHKR